MDSSSGTEILNRKWGYVILLSKFVTNMTGSGIAKSFGLLLPEMVERFHGNYATLGFICSIPGTIMLFSGPFISLILQKMDHRLVAMLGGLMSGVFLVSCGFISNLAVFGVILALTGIGRACVYLPIALLVNEYFTENFVLLNTIAFFGTTVGVMLLPIVAERSLEAYGYSGVFMILGAIMLHLVAGGAAIRKPVFEVSDAVNDRVIDDDTCVDEDEVDLDDGPSCQLLQDSDEEEHGGPKLKTGTSMNSFRMATGNAGQDRAELSMAVNHRRILKESRFEGTCREKTINDDNNDDINKESIPLLDSTTNDPGDVEDVTRASESFQDDRDRSGFCSSFFSRCKLFLRKERLFLICLPTVFLRIYSFDAWVLFLVPHAEQLGIVPSRAVFLSSIGGIGGIAGRAIALVLLAQKVHMFRIYIILGFTTSLSFFLDFIGKAFVIRSMLAFLQGLCFFVIDTGDANFLKLVLVDEENFSFGLGLIMFVHGSGSVAAGFLTGTLFDVTQSYTIVFMLTGIVVVLYTVNIVIVSILVNRRNESMDQQRCSRTF